MRQNGGVKVDDDGEPGAAVTRRVVEEQAHRSRSIEGRSSVSFRTEAKDGEPLRRSACVPDKIEDVAGTYNGGVAGALLLSARFFAGKRLGIARARGARCSSCSARRCRSPSSTAAPGSPPASAWPSALLGIMFFRKTGGGFE